MILNKLQFQVLISIAIMIVIAPWILTFLFNSIGLAYAAAFLSSIMGWFLVWLLNQKAG